MSLKWSRQEYWLSKIECDTIVTTCCEWDEVDCLAAGLWCNSSIRKECSMSSEHMKSNKFHSRLAFEVQELREKKLFAYLTSNSPSNPADVWIESTNRKSFLLYASVENFVKNGPAGSRAVNLIEKLEERFFFLCADLHAWLFTLKCHLVPGENFYCYKLTRDSLLTVLKFTNVL